MGIIDAATEANAGRQLEIYVSSILSLQETASALINKALMVMLQVMGIQGTVELMFKKQRISDRKVLAETEKIAIENIITKQEAGLITEDEAKQDVASLRVPFFLGEE